MLDQISNIAPCLKAACINGLIGIRKKKKIWEIVKKNKVDVSLVEYVVWLFLDIVYYSRMSNVFEVPEC